MTMTSVIILKKVFASTYSNFFSNFMKKNQYFIYLYFCFLVLPSAKDGHLRLPHLEMTNTNLPHIDSGFCSSCVLVWC
jgi:hypothetical protein